MKQHGGGAGPIRSILLAVLLALGLAAMHTLGHVRGGETMPVPADVSIAMSHEATSTSHHGGTPSADHDVASVCLAILASLLLLIVPLLSFAGLFESPQERARKSRHSAESLRGPPTAVVLKRTVVLRT